MKIKIELEFDTENEKDNRIVEKLTNAIDTLNRVENSNTKENQKPNHSNNKS